MSKKIKRYNHREVEIDKATVVTVVPYTDGPEYREYVIGADELPNFLMNMDDPQHAERVISIDIDREEE